jgi:hypothetical protein
MMPWTLIVTLAEDGVAWRYRMGAPAPTGDGKSSPTFVLNGEATRVHLPENARIWTLEYQTWYETQRFAVDVHELREGDYGFPTLFTVDDEVFVLLSESDISRADCGSHLRYDATSPEDDASAPPRPSHSQALSIVPADSALTVAPGHTTPWRVAIIGTLAEVVTSELVDQLASPALDERGLDLLRVARPGRAAWSWWSSQYSGAYLDVQKRFTDFAHAQGWEHVLVDCGWDPTWVPELVSYASQRGVQVHLWSSWSDLDGPEALRKLELWRSWGVAGIKVDFMESESQERYRWYDDILRETARVGLMVNFHGSVIPRGWAKTFPHVMSYEAVRGAEYYSFYDAPFPASHNVIQPFTRNVVGSVDYTPVAFSAQSRQTSDAHELALSIAFESGITHFADDPREYAARPDACALLAELPPAWDETRLVAGHPDKEAVVARRNGDRWFIAGIATGPARSITVNLADFYSTGCGWLVYDKPDGSGLTSSDFTIPESGAFTIPIIDNGGFTVILAASTDDLRRAIQRPILAKPDIAKALVTLDDSDQVTIEIDHDARPRLPPGWCAKPIELGVWRLTAATDTDPGDVAIVSVEANSQNYPPVISHIRIVKPYTVGDYDVSRLPFLSVTNTVGPVERDLANGGGDPTDGAPLTVAGTIYSHGLGVSDASSIELFTAGARRLRGLVAIDDETPTATGIAQIWADDELVYQVKLAPQHTPTAFNIRLPPSSTARLRTLPDPGSPEAHIDWLNVHLVAGPVTDPQQ